MQTILNVVVPIFALIAAAILAARHGPLAASVGDALAKFVFVIAVPALLFRTMATAASSGRPTRSFSGSPISSRSR